MEQAKQYKQSALPLRENWELVGDRSLEITLAAFLNISHCYIALEALVTFIVRISNCKNRSGEVRGSDTLLIRRRPFYQIE